MAKTNPLFILIGVLAVAFFILMLSSSSVVPYDNKNHYATYEPMTPVSTPVSEYKKESDTEPKEKSIGSGLFSAVSGVFGTENFEPMVDEPKTVQYGPLRDSETIDKFSQVKENGMDGVNGCVSSGLSNSGGYICLTPELIDMLKTRGGNAKGT
jgi:hypothetical protein